LEEVEERDEGTDDLVLLASGIGSSGITTVGVDMAVLAAARLVEGLLQRKWPTARQIGLE